MKTLLAGVAIVAVAAPLASQSSYRRWSTSMAAAAVADSIAVVASLEHRVRADPSDADAWHRLGIVAWTLWERAASPDPPPTLDRTRLGRLADTALRIAADLRKTNVGFRLDVGRFLMAGATGTTRLAAQAQFARALNAARASRDLSLLADAALELGWSHWRRYDALANRHLATVSAGSMARSISQAMAPLARAADALEEQDRLQGIIDATGGRMSLRDAARLGTMDANRLLAGSASQRSPAEAPGTSLRGVRELIENSTRKLPDDATGMGDLTLATTLFVEAHATAPFRAGVFRAAAMALADRQRWAELELLARRHLANARAHGLAWLSLGLAAHRMSKTSLAQAAFDTALRVLHPSDRERLDNWTRVLSRSGAARAAQAGPAVSAKEAMLFWQLVDPVWSDGSNDRRNEFLARVAFAELRWTVEELDLHGVDTDRGDVFVRYGPPDLIAVIGPEGAGDGPAANVTTFWMYNSGLMFAFAGLPTFATAYTPRDDIDLAESMKDAIPVRWGNVPSPQLDAISVQVARFRGGRDSVDVVIAALLPAEDVRRSTEVRDAEVVSGFWLIASDATVARHIRGTLDTTQSRQWTTRLPTGGYAYRAEVFAASATRVAQSSGAVDAGDSFARSGFGLSDVLLASGASRATEPGRWKDLAISPSGGVFESGAQLTLLWECYELPMAAGVSSYDVTVTLGDDKAGSGELLARVVGSLARIARVGRGRPGGLTFSYSRHVQGAPVVVEQLDIVLDGARAGAYVVTVEVVDRTSGVRASRTARFTVAR